VTQNASRSRPMGTAIYTLKPLIQGCIVVSDDRKLMFQINTPSNKLQESPWFQFPIVD